MNINIRELLFLKRKIKNCFRRLFFIKPKPAKESKIVHQYLDGLNGIEIGGSTHNPFGLDKTGGYANLDYTTNHAPEKWFAQGFPVAKVNIVSLGDDLPFKDSALDYVVSSHVIEHFFDPIKAIKEWLRVVKKDGFVIMIVPHKERTFDVNKLETDYEELLKRHSGEIQIQDYIEQHDKTHDKTSIKSFNHKLIKNKELSNDAIRYTTDDHHHWCIWRTEDFLELCKVSNFNVVEYQDVDDKVGNGFFVVLKK